MKMRGRISRVETEKVMHQDKKRRMRDREKERKREEEIQQTSGVSGGTITEPVC